MQADRLPTVEMRVLWTQLLIGNNFTTDPVASRFVGARQALRHCVTSPVCTAYLQDSVLRDSYDQQLEQGEVMRKIIFALGAIAFVCGTAALPASAATKPSKDPATASASASKKVLVKKAAKPAKTAKADKVAYKSKCKAGQKWDATATITAGACVKKAKVPTKAAKKAA